MISKWVISPTYIWYILVLNLWYSHFLTCQTLGIPQETHRKTLSLWADFVGV